MTIKLITFLTLLLQLPKTEGIKEILNTREVTIIGVLLLLIITLTYGVIFLYKRNERLSEKRLAEQKEFTKELLDVTKATNETVKQVNEMLKITSTKDVQ